MSATPQQDHAAPAAPFAEHALGYRQAGWPVLPLAPGSKGPPPDGYTGRTGVDASEPDVWSWTEDRPHANIALRMPPGVIGIDVDHYGDKHGLDTLIDLVAECGPLPPAPWSSARDDGASGIRYFRVPDGYQSIGRLAGIEFIQRHHRYAVAPPSVHPEGMVYRWHAADGTELDTVPRVDELPELPQAWLSRLADDHRGDTAKTSLSGPEADAAFERLVTPGEPCRCAREALGAILGELHGGSSRHDTMCAAQVRLLRLGEQGHPGIGAAVQTLENAFRAAIGNDRVAIDEEWSRGLAGAIELITSNPRPGSGCLDGTALELTSTSETDPHGGQAPSGDLVTLSTVRAEDVTWLWPGRLPAGKLALVDGDPSLGKSTLGLDLAAHVSTGRSWPDGTDCPAGDVVLMSAEDGIADTIRPRLDAAGANSERVHAFTSVTARGEDGTTHSRPPTLADVDSLHGVVTRTHARLLIVDVLMAYLPGKVDSHRDQDVRGVLHKLAELANDTGCAVLLLRHLNKTSGGSALYRGGGSIGIVGAARAGFLVAPDPDDESGKTLVLACMKQNLAPMPDSLNYRLETAAGTHVARVAWSGQSSHGASDLLSTADAEDRSERDEAVEWLKSYLADQGGTARAGDVIKAAGKDGIAKTTLTRARQRAGVTSDKDGMRGGWVWSIDELDHRHRRDHEESEESRTTGLDSSDSSGDPSRSSAHPSGSTTPPKKEGPL